MTTLVWLRRDLRLADNPALLHAARRGPLVCAFVWAPEEEAPWQPGAASNWWLHQSLEALGAQLARLGASLVLRRGPTLGTLRQLAREAGADAVYWNRLYEPKLVERDKQIKRQLVEGGIEAKSFNAALLFEPWTVQTKQGDPYRVFTPYFKQCLALAPARELAPMPAPKRLSGPELDSEQLPALELEPKLDWASGFYSVWKPGEDGALGRLSQLGQLAPEYQATRDFPARPGTSRLSPHLHFGEVGPRQVWAELGAWERPEGREILRELVWREFAHHLLYHFPHTPDENLRAEFDKFPWRKDAAQLRAWQRGRTGYPLVDAGMRELWATGWMHNRVRMVVASFLVKHLRIHWLEGARWFWDTLVDADLANNTLGWQWSAGSGADAAPYFRVFNPYQQADKFDRDASYVRRWVQELGSDRYPEPIVEHRSAREQALAAYREMRAAD